MANTNKLKEVESEIIDKFCHNHNCNKLDSIPKSKLKQMFLGMQPDLVAYDKNNSVLYICEITVSGFNGHRGKDFHLGAARKLAESFSKFYLLSREKSEIQRKLHPECDFKMLSCYFIVPKGSRFIKALGYRENLFKTEIMRLEEIDLSHKSMKFMLGTLEDSKNEMTKYL
jgi:hypothetical protein